MRTYRMWIAAGVLAVLGLAPVAMAQTAAQAQAGGTLERIRTTGQLRLGYLTDARPFSFRDASGNPAGFTVDLCRVIAERLTADRGQAVTVEWVPVDIAARFTAVAQGQVDLLCGAETETLARRAQAAFSIPIFPGGIGALIRTDAPGRLKDALSGRPVTPIPNWRATAAQALQRRQFAVVGGTTAETWLAGRLSEFQLASKALPVESHDAGVEAVLSRRADAFFSDRAVLLDAATRSPGADDLVVLDRLYTQERIALALARGDEDFRLLVDQTLSGIYSSGAIDATYTTWFGAPSESVQNFYRWITLPD